MVGLTLTTIFVGFIIGALGRLVVPGKQPLAWWLTLLIGVVGATGGTALAYTLKFTDKEGFNLMELICQVGIAAILVVAVSKFLARD